MNFDYRKYPSPGVIDGAIQDLQEQQRAHRTELTLGKTMGEAITYLEMFRNLLRSAYITDSNREKFERLNHHPLEGN